MNWFKIGKGGCQGCILSLCLFNFHAEYIMWNARLDESQPGIKITRRNINNLRYADDTIVMAESEEELKSLLMRAKEESEKSWLKTQHSKNEDRGIQLHHFAAKKEGKSRSNDRFFYFLGSKITVDGDCTHEIKRPLLLGRKSYDKLKTAYEKAETAICQQRPIQSKLRFSQ